MRTAPPAAVFCLNRLLMETCFMFSINMFIRFCVTTTNKTNRFQLQFVCVLVEFSGTVGNFSLHVEFFVFWAPELNFLKFFQKQGKSFSCCFSSQAQNTPAPSAARQNVRPRYFLCTNPHQRRPDASGSATTQHFMPLLYFRWGWQSFFLERTAANGRLTLNVYR